MILVRDFEKRYKHAVLRLGDMDIEDACTLLVGKNGCGKTTLLKALAGLCDHRGHISAVSTMSLIDGERLPMGMKVKDYLNHIGALQGHMDTALFERLNLSQTLPQRIGTLSKGMRQKLALSVTLSADVAWILLDEPLDGIDEQSIEVIIDYLRTMEAKLIIATHAPEIYDRLAAKVIAL